MIKANCKIKEVLSKELAIIREVASLLGLLNDLCKGTEYGLVLTKRLEVDKIWGLRRAGPLQYGGLITISPKAKEDLEWWMKNLGMRRKFGFLLPLSP